MGDIEEVFRAVPRIDFVPESQRLGADIDAPLPIGFGQTISQPTTVRLMLEWLEPQPGDKVLDVGSGSGWTAALLSRLVGSRGHVHAVEIIPELVRFGKDNCGRLGLKNVEFHQAGKTFGWPAAAPYDRILVSAAANETPAELVQQLKPGGKLVIPVLHDVLEIEKMDDGTHDTVSHPGFAFVPLIMRE